MCARFSWESARVKPLVLFDDGLPDAHAVELGVLLG